MSSIDQFLLFAVVWFYSGAVTAAGILAYKWFRRGEITVADLTEAGGTFLMGLASAVFLIVISGLMAMERLSYWLDERRDHVLVRRKVKK